jgi:aspartate/glutamate racemase
MPSHAYAKTIGNDFRSLRLRHQNNLKLQIPSAKSKEAVNFNIYNEMLAAQGVTASQPSFLKSPAAQAVVP